MGVSLFPGENKIFWTGVSESTESINIVEDVDSCC